MCGLQGLGAWTCHNGKVLTDGCDTIKALVTEGFVPVLHGDGVLDTVKGCTILSGDSILQVMLTYGIIMVKHNWY